MFGRNPLFRVPTTFETSVGAPPIYQSAQHTSQALYDEFFSVHKVKRVTYFFQSTLTLNIDVFYNVTAFSRLEIYRSIG